VVGEIENMEIWFLMYNLFLYLDPFELVVIQSLVEVLLFSYYIIKEHNTYKQICQKESTDIDNEDDIDQHNHFVIIDGSILIIIAINVSVGQIIPTLYGGEHKNT